MNGRLIEGNIKMRCKTIAKLFVVSLVIWTGSPALATQHAHHAYCEQKAGTCRHPTFGTCIARENCVPRGNGRDTTRDDWPAGMILD